MPIGFSGAVRFVARRFAASGQYLYSDYYGHTVEADLTDYMERVGFFGAHSSNLLRSITGRLSPGDWVIDVGANVGLFAAAMCAAVGREGHVWAFEPVPRNVARLEALKKVNDLRQLTIFPVALGSKSSVAQLRIPALAGGSGFGSFVATWERSGVLDVVTTPLDLIVKSQGPDRPLRLIKIDVEGFETEVLAGALATMANHRPLVLCEFHDPLLRSAGSSAGALYEQFRACGFVCRKPSKLPKGSLDGISWTCFWPQSDSPRRGRGVTQWRRP